MSANPKQGKRVGVWIRVSTEDQAAGESPQHHEFRAKRYAEFNEWTVMEVYDLPSMRACHFDFYRFDDPQEWEDAGFREVFADPGLKLVEWPDKAKGLMPQPDLSITISALSSSTPDDARLVVFDAHSATGQALLP